MSKRKKYDDDDGRTVANMNVDGMPWYASNPSNNATENSGIHGKSDRWGDLALVWGVLKAALLVTAIFAVGYLLFILFCTLVWFA